MATPRDRREPRRGPGRSPRGERGGAATGAGTGPKRAARARRGADGFAPRPRTAKAETRSGAPPRRERPRGDSKRALAKRRVRRRSPPSPRDARRDARSIMDRHGEEPRRAGEADESSRHSWRCHFARGGLGRVITHSASHHQSHRSVSLAVASDLPRNPLAGFGFRFFLSSSGFATRQKPPDADRSGAKSDAVVAFGARRARSSPRSSVCALGRWTSIGSSPSAPPRDGRRLRRRGVLGRGRAHARGARLRGRARPRGRRGGDDGSPRGRGLERGCRARGGPRRAGDEVLGGDTRPAPDAAGDGVEVEGRCTRSRRTACAPSRASRPTSSKGAPPARAPRPAPRPVSDATRRLPRVARGRDARPAPR